MHSKSLSRNTTAHAVDTEQGSATAGFPTVRYFQIHFEFLQEQLHLTQTALQALQNQLEQLQQQCGAKSANTCHAGLEGVSCTLKHQASPKVSTKQSS